MSCEVNAQSNPETWISGLEKHERTQDEKKTLAVASGKPGPLRMALFGLPF